MRRSVQRENNSTRAQRHQIFVANSDSSKYRLAIFSWTCIWKRRFKVLFRHRIYWSILRRITCDMSVKVIILLHASFQLLTLEQIQKRINTISIVFRDLLQFSTDERTELKNLDNDEKVKFLHSSKQKMYRKLWYTRTHIYHVRNIPLFVSLFFKLVVLRFRALFSMRAITCLNFRIYTVPVTNKILCFLTIFFLFSCIFCEQILIRELSDYSQLLFYRFFEPNRLSYFYTMPMSVPYLLCSLWIFE